MYIMWEIKASYNLRFHFNPSNRKISIDEPPISYTWAGHVGPITVKQSKRTRRNPGQSKHYGLVFTCVTIIEELAGNLTTNFFSLALRQLIVRRSPPISIWSNNGTSLVGGNA